MPKTWGSQVINYINHGANWLAKQSPAGEKMISKAMFAGNSFASATEAIGKSVSALGSVKTGNLGIAADYLGAKSIGGAIGSFSRGSIGRGAGRLGGFMIGDTPGVARSWGRNLPRMGARWGAIGALSYGASSIANGSISGVPQNMLYGAYRGATAPVRWPAESITGMEWY